MNAKAGDKIEEKARRAYAKALGNCPINAIETRVAPKTAGEGGQHFCVTCGAFPANNIEAFDHERNHRKHKIAWRSAESGKIEEP